MSVVLDASAVIALLYAETGHDVIARQIAELGGIASAVNMAEVEAKLIDRGVAADHVSAACDALPLFVAPFTAVMARASAQMRPATRDKDLSLADRACLATARALGSPVLTTDQAWRSIDVGVDVRLAR